MAKPYAVRQTWLRMLRWAAPFALLLLALPAAGWSQIGGPGHSGVADLPAVLDVVRTQRLAPAGWVQAQADVFETSTGGIVSLVREFTEDEQAASRCSLAILETGGEAELLGQAFDCSSLRTPSLAPPEPVPPAGAGNLVAGNPAALLATVPSLEQILVCGYALSGEPLIHAFGEDGAALWTVAAPVDGADGPASAADDRMTPAHWTCGAPAIDDPAAVAYIPLRRGAEDNRILALALDGTTRWSQFVKIYPAHLLPEAVEQGPAFVPMSVTRTDTGLVVLGFQYANAVSLGLGVSTPLQVPSPSTSLPAFALLDFNGTVGAAVAVRLSDAYQAVRNGHEPRMDTPFLSYTAAASGPLATFLAGTLAITVDPGVPFNWY